MQTRLELILEFEDKIREGCKARFPSLDADWAVNRYMDKIHEINRKAARILVSMMPEVLRISEEKGEQIATSKAK